MATIEGVYLADDRDNLIFEYPTSATSPSLKTVLSTVKGCSSQSDASSSVGQPHNEAIVEVSRSHAVYRQAVGRIIAYALVRQCQEDESLKLQSISNDDKDNEYDDLNDDDGGELDASKAVKKSGTMRRAGTVPVVNPSIMFVVLQRLISTLLDYFGTPLNPLKIEANYDVMCNLMQEFVQGGSPYITDLNALRDLVPFKPSLGSTILSTTNQIAKNYVSGTPSLSALSSSTGISSMDLEQERVPWRSANVKYTNNEVFMDITETINVVLSHHTSKKSKQQQQSHRLVPTLAVLEGQVEFTSHLSGLPDVLVNLNTNGQSLGCPSFHRCVRVDRWLNREGSLSFIPPDGKSTLMNYTVELDRVTSNKSQRSLGIIMPEYKRGLGVKRNEFEIIMSLSLLQGVSKIDRLTVSVSHELYQSVKILRVSHGDVQTGKQGKCEWVFEPDQKLGVTAVLRGIIGSDQDMGVDENGDEIPSNVSYPREISLSYRLKGALPSGLRVESIKITRGMGDITPYKGVKYITRTGDFVIR